MDSRREPASPRPDDRRPAICLAASLAATFSLLGVANARSPVGHPEAVRVGPDEIRIHYHRPKPFDGIPLTYSRKLTRLSGRWQLSKEAVSTQSTQVLTAARRDHAKDLCSMVSDRDDFLRVRLIDA